MPVVSTLQQWQNLQATNLAGGDILFKKVFTIDTTHGLVAAARESVIVGYQAMTMWPSQGSATSEHVLMMIDEVATAEAVGAGITRPSALYFRNTTHGKYDGFQKTSGRTEKSWRAGRSGPRWIDAVLQARHEAELEPRKETRCDSWSCTR
ncbi:MAG TPA: hypothetical protein VNO21_23710 [Polyangiaceae bacterium]|nr:hypothetical protein [Polyangiaceae bacterium]